MTGPEAARIRQHEDPALFREAVSFTAAETGFASRLIEKDYFCTVLLQHLTTAGTDLVFRGGTCLAKVHLGFYRLSEDLDFLIPTQPDASRGERSRRVAASKRALARVEQQLPGLRVVTTLTGANDSRQYAAVVGYASLLGAEEETIGVEIGLREPLLTPAVHGDAQTLLLDPISGAPMVPALSVPCLSQAEAMAEKARAALSRREPAIRDFYDIDHAVRRLGLRLGDPALVALIKQKLAVPANEAVDVSKARLAALKLQLQAELKAVLRDQDFAEFDLERAFATVVQMAGAVA
jgi:predicted nucleotidyltransferase component of viral defense system